MAGREKRGGTRGGRRSNPLNEVHQAIAAVSEAQDALAIALREGDMAKAEQAMAAMAVAERRRNRLVHATVAAAEDGVSYVAEPPLRESVIRALELLSRPSPTALVADISRARWGQYLDASRMASLRRDETRSYDAAPAARPVYVTPALTSDRFAPVRGALTLSSWALEDRIVAPSSPRVDMLRTVVRLADELEDADAVWAPAVTRVLWRLARTVPGALERGVDPALDLDRVRKAVRAELAHIDDADREERRAAAERATAQLPPEQILFGSPGLRAVSRPAKEA